MVELLRAGVVQRPESDPIPIELLLDMLNSEDAAVVDNGWAKVDERGASADAARS